MPQICWTDGACIGKEGARFGGYGVYWGPGDARNISQPLPASMPHTNQRAELSAIICALEQISEQSNNSNHVIVSDSRYSIDCVTKWRSNWLRNNWQTSAKEPVKNRDLIEYAGLLFDTLNAQQSQVTFEWCKGLSRNVSFLCSSHLIL